MTTGWTNCAIAIGLLICGLLLYRISDCLSDCLADWSNWAIVASGVMVGVILGVIYILYVSI